MAHDPDDIAFARRLANEFVSLKLNGSIADYLNLRLDGIFFEVDDKIYLINAPPIEIISLK